MSPDVDATTGSALGGQRGCSLVQHDAAKNRTRAKWARV